MKIINLKILSLLTLLIRASAFGASSEAVLNERVEASIERLKLIPKSITLSEYMTAVQSGTPITHINIELSSEEELTNAFWETLTPLAPLLQTFQVTRNNRLYNTKSNNDVRYTKTLILEGLAKSQLERLSLEGIDTSFKSIGATEETFKYLHNIISYHIMIYVP